MIPLRSASAEVTAEKREETFYFQYFEHFKGLFR